MFRLETLILRGTQAGNPTAGAEAVAVPRIHLQRTSSMRLGVRSDYLKDPDEQKLRPQ
jgi:hypothetical protein